MQIIIIVSIGRQVDAKAVQEQQEDKNNRCQNNKHLISMCYCTRVRRYYLLVLLLETQVTTTTTRLCSATNVGVQNKNENALIRICRTEINT